SMPASGGAASPKPAPTAATLPLPPGTRRGTLSWPAGTPPGSSRCRRAAPVGRHPGGGCSGGGRGARPPGGRPAACSLAPPRAAPPPDASPPRVSLDAGEASAPRRRAVADAPLGVLVRWRAGRCFSADSTTLALIGRPEPTAQWATKDPQYGRVSLQAGSGLQPVAQRPAQRGTRTH